MQIPGSRCNNCFEEYDKRYEVCPHCGFVDGSPSSELYHLFPGTILQERYVIGMVLGFGGFGITYKAWDMSLETIIAIKEYYPGGLVNRVPGTKDVILFTRNRQQVYNHGLASVLEEARNMAKFSAHKNIINVFGYFEENNTAYIVMEFLDGITLGDFLKTNGKMSVESCADIIEAICTALTDVHSSGIIHRDVSPDNIFLCTNQNVKIIDFGAARFSSQEEFRRDIILKPGFAPPEQYEKVSAQGPWTDIYALGATFYYMITGEKPDESTNRKENDPLLSPRDIVEDISENISNIIMQAMAVDRHMRFATVSDFEKALGSGKKVLPIATQVRRRKRYRVTGIVAAFLIIATASFFLYRSWQEQLLPDASITLAFPLTGNIPFDNERLQAFSSIIEEFVAAHDYADITIEIQTIYQAEFESAILGNPKALFESTGFSQAALEEIAVSLQDTLSRINVDDYFFLGEYVLSFSHRLPLGFNLPIIYINNAITERDYSNTDGELFFNGEEGAYLSDTSEFFAVQDTLDFYSLSFVESVNIEPIFSELWSIGNHLSDDEMRVAERFLRYLLGENSNAQDFLFIRRRGNMLPIKRTAFQVFTEIHTDFEGFYEYIDEEVLS